MARKADYGRGHPNFLEYVDFIFRHPAYKGMPDAELDDGSIQWEAPSNRTGGKFKDTHHKRREWWRAKAVEVGIDPNSAHWISKTAKFIHPTKKKPCKNCGKEMDIRYSHPSHILMKRITKLDYIDESFPLDPLEHILDLVPRFVEQCGDQVFRDLPALLKSKGVTIPSLPDDTGAWLKWIESEYMPLEPKTLSPGVMSNAPDRFDGFHSFNLCCRSKADKGRSKENLQSYVTDRRVFEYWVDGDWVSADRLMGIIRSNKAMKNESCLNGHPGPCSADHIGPISLGFCHRPEFQLLCHSCNSAKNNRMFFSDVRHLRHVQEAGETVASWYCQKLWDALKNSVADEETALRLSKVLRDNRHTAMAYLYRFYEAGRLAFLSSFLGLDFADKAPDFQNLRVGNHITQFDEITQTGRTTKYADEQKARRIRVAFSSLVDYISKENRNAYIVLDDGIEACLNQALAALDASSQEARKMDERLRDALINHEDTSDEALRAIAHDLSHLFEGEETFSAARKKLKEALARVADVFSSMWENERYIRVYETDDE